MDKRSILGFVLIGIVLMIWLYMSSPTPPPKKTETTTTDTTKVTKIDTLKTPVDTVKQTAPPVVVVQDTLPKTPEAVITVQTDVAVIETTNKGGNLKKFFLKNYKRWDAADKKENALYYEKDVQLVRQDSTSSLKSGLNIAFRTRDGNDFSTANVDFVPSTQEWKFEKSKSDSLRITYAYEYAPGSFIKKHYTFYGDRYDFSYTIEFINMSKFIDRGSYDLVWNNGINFVEYNSSDEANYSNASVYHGDEQAIVNASGNERIEETFSGKVQWFTVRNKYFAAIVAPPDPTKVQEVIVSGFSKPLPDKGINEYYNVTAQMPFSPRDSVQSDTYLVYLGPVTYDILKTYDKNFDKIVDFGSFFGLKFIVRPIAEYVFLPLFKFLHSFIPNYGIVILLFALFVKVILYPLSRKQMMSFRKMQLLNPKLKEIKEKHKEDPQEVQKQTMKLYSTYGINPMGGCLPLVLQMPIFIALWGLFQTIIELRQQPFFLWIHDLSRPDIILNLGFAIPLFGIQEISGLALLMGITTFLQQKMTVQDPSQKAMIYIMPVFLTLLFMSFPSGLNLYYFTFNLLSIAHQMWYNRRTSDMVLEPVTNPKKGFMQRVSEMQEQQAKSQKHSKKR